MNKMKYWLTTMAVLLCSITTSAHDFEVNGIYYKITSSYDLEVSVTYKGSSYGKFVDEYSGAVTIPSTVPYNDKIYSVTSIVNGAFRECSSLTAITIPEGVKVIPTSAFQNCSNLTSITLSEGVTSIGLDAFYGCSSLTAINIPESVTSIGSYAFYNCTSLVAVHISNIAAWCNINFSSSETNPLYYAKSLYLNGELVTELIIPEGVTSIGNYTFNNCNSLVAMNIPESVTSIGKNAFKGCCNLTNINIPEAVKSIGEHAFYNCSGLININIPEYVTSIGEHTFYNCSSLIAINIPGTSQLASIGKYAFCGCSSLSAINIPQNVACIGEHAFYNCSNLIAINIPETSQLTSIEKCAFGNCSNLTAINIPEVVTSIGDYAFEYCSSLTSINIPEVVISIGGYAFIGCTSLTAVHISNIVTWCSIKFTSSFTNPLYYAKSLYMNGELVTELIIPKGITSIGNYTFYNCRSLTAINISESVTSIGDFAFYGCSSLVNITIPEDVTSIGKHAFRECSSLTNINIPENVTSIGEHAFRECGSLTTITIPEGVKVIPTSAFQNCSNLTSITLPEGVTSIEYQAFRECNSLANINIPKSVTSIGDFAFWGCSSLVNITISEDVTSIGSDAFMGCRNLNAFTIPESMASIGLRAFYNCTGLTTIICRAETPPTIGSSSTFYNVDKSIPVYVPAGSVKDYETAQYWSEFTNIQAIPSIDIASGTCGDNLTWKLTEDGELVIEGTGAMKDFNENDVPWIEYTGDHIKSVTISDGVTTIGRNAFRHCYKLFSVSVPEGITTIGAYAFNYCNSLSSITIPKSVTAIMNHAFYNCWGLSSITLPEKLSLIAPYAFYNCGFQSITSEAATPPICYEEAFTGTEKSIPVYVPKSSISDYQSAAYWKEFTNIQPIIIAFGDCGDNLTWKLTDDGKLTIEGTGAMYGYGWSDSPLYSHREFITEVVIPEGVTNIGEGVFWDCTGLTEVTIPAGVTSIDNYAFAGCRNLVSVSVSESVTSIGHYAFQSCEELATINIPEGVTNIGNNTFQDCHSLASITIPANVTSIGSHAFWGCSGLTSIICNATTPPAIADQWAINDVDRSISVYVPRGSSVSYKEDADWGTFTNIRILNGESYTLVVKGAGYATLYLGYDVEIPENVEVYYASKVQHNYLMMTPVEGAIPAGTGVVIKAVAGEYTFDEVEGISFIRGSLFVGTTENTYITAVKGYRYYVLSQVDGVVGMYRAKIKDNGTFLNNANRAYLALDMGKLGIFDGETNTDEEGGQLSNRLRFDFGGETGIEKTTGNGQQTTIIYDLQGRKVADAEGLKGIYIVGGKKVVIK